MLHFNLRKLILTCAVATEKSLYGQAWMHATVKTRVAVDCARTGSREELRQYFTAPLELVDDVVLWWGVCAHCNVAHFFFAHFP